MKPLQIGVLALQGAFVEHEKILNSLGAEVFEIRQLKDLKRNINGLVLPGGESTVQGKLLHELGLFESLKNLIQNGITTFGTCAGAILLAEKIEGEKKSHFGTIPMTVKRNAYGRQLGSFFTKAELKNVGEIPMTFIRAPIIESVLPEVQVLAKVQSQIGEKIVAVQYKNQIALSFHPELNHDTKVHEYFLNIARVNVKVQN